MRDYMKALCYRFETTSRRAEYLDRKVERTYRQLTRLLDEPERKLLLKMADPVSYTHLDVYKRQGLECLNMVSEPWFFDQIEKTADTLYRCV